MGIWRTADWLADRRAIIYFDECEGRPHPADRRDLAPRQAAGSALRTDPLAGEQVMYAATRQDRPYRPDLAGCPLCPSRPDRMTEIPAADYDVVVFENRYPALDGPGRCEVVCFTSEHDTSFARLSPRRVRTVFEAWTDRTAELGALPDVEHVYCFENRGEEIGVTLPHPHGQVYAFPFVPQRTQRLAAMAAAHREQTGQNLFEHVVAAEIEDGVRIVGRNEHWTAFVPRFARWPFEVMIFPVMRVADLTQVDRAAMDAFGPVYLDVLRRFDALFGVPMPYIAAWQQAPAGDEASRAEFGLHLHLMGIRRALGKLKYQAGTETGAGAWSNDVLPEAAAELLRDAL